ncbi:hypothetical protein Mal15_38630 [Stieleria maiorica]|uniref:Uncharacterized protein n=1 Tax=Stieleria maiorica TaxID=2795974 RepID=A0A5B9MIG9_9BACT|nr:hypothetical protein [Stieleria maiorica]QEF99796.1 hypothetical protein Mal15_38630 [Stieleria maiorica]
MNVLANPYQSPPETDQTPDSEVQGSGLAFLCFCTGATSVLMGLGALMVPNLPPLGFMLLALALFVVSLFASRAYRRRAIIAIVLCFVLGLGMLFQLRLMHARIATQRAREHAIVAAREAERAAARAAQSQTASRPANQVDSTIVP